MNRQEKSIFIEKIKKDLMASESTFLVSYKGLSVPKLEALRKDLRKENAFLQVAKMRLVKIAVKDLESNLLSPMLERQLCLVFASQGSPSVAKLLSKFAKNNKELELIGGFFESKVLNKESFIALSKLPSREQLLAQLCGTLKAPIACFANILDAVLKQKESQSA